MYPNDYCQPCQQTVPPVTVPPPPVCNGEPCVELYKDDCVLYTGPNFPCLNVQRNERLESVLIKIMTKLTQCCCDGTPQPVDCVVSEWGPWSECIDGEQTRTRTVVTPASNGGDPCPALEETRECCEPVDCVVSAWGAWSACNNGVRTRTRTVVTPASCGGDPCPSLIETEECCTPVNCVVSEWGPWSECVNSLKTRTRTVITPASCGGTPCPALSETVDCIPTQCPAPEFSVTSVNCEAIVVTVAHIPSNPTVSLEYQVAGSATWTAGGMLTTTLAGQNTITVSGLNELTNYNIRVKTKCTGGDSAWVTAEATTLECVAGCPVPSGLTYEEVCTRTENGITASATVSGATVLSLQFSLVHVNSNTEIDSHIINIPGGGSASANFFGLGLISGDSYKVRVKTICEGFEESSTIELTFIKNACRPADDCDTAEIEEGWVTIDAPDCPSIGFLYNVNIPASATWAEGSDINITVYETGTSNLLAQDSLSYSDAPTNSNQWTFDQLIGGGLIDPINMNLSGTQITLNMTMNCGDTVKQKTLTYTVTDCPEGCTTPTGLSAQTLG
jgi:hypothetical protein